ncbi:hypothetical protein S7711_11472 [Stachybotrys chartarum IBT 7711]|uniref:Uncharacterized protein n=1 Tax=Stachybotrys chartarum (strain CBS 109288 / IBT 7711) TaxID=1280523 RepID=A0A084ARS3_STACB|nr:hypothetical protein S7711_11472 [Stachybotrys chartarum IBT 7711]KFA54026.1 hypothetical protein S40293_01805 [Stachybotrys chartarum IBT 40293]KFA72181.1 hypothetical protein S40288_06019 [Stachybotrys chartarum IBT 40288]
MAHDLFPNGGDPTHERDRGLRFTNDEWNGSFSNGQPVTLRWNESLPIETAQLNLFKVIYPEQGLVMYDMVSNLSDCVSATTCKWTPKNLDDGLYTLLLTNQSDSEPGWAFSPLWRPEIHPSRPFHWAAPVGIPIVVLLGVYALGLLTYFLHRRRKKTQGQGVNPDDADGRHPSFSSVITVQTLEEPEGAKKPEVWLYEHAPASTLPATRASPPDSERPRKVREPEKARLDCRSDTRRSSIA